MIAFETKYQVTLRPLGLKKSLPKAIKKAVIQTCKYRLKLILIPVPTFLFNSSVHILFGLR
jgi:hypothetical protein